MTPQELPPPIALFRMITGYYLSRAIHVAAQLGIADLLAQGPLDARSLAAGTATHAPSLSRMLRLLVGAVNSTSPRVLTRMRSSADRSIRGPSGESKLQTVELRMSALRSSGW